jgi:hypothetical protein
MVLRLMPRSPRRRIRLVTVVDELAVLLTRLGLQNLRRLDTSNGCQDHTVLPYAATRLRQKGLRRALAPFVWCALIAHGRTALRPQARPTLPRPPHPAPTFVTMANAPLRRTGRAAYSFDLPDGRSGIFLQPGLDRANHVDPAQEIRRLAHMLLVASNAVSGPIDAFSNDA